jgi:hypothetical protein
MYPDRAFEKNYDPGPFFGEMFASADQPRPHYRPLYDYLGTIGPAAFAERRLFAARHRLHRIALPIEENSR